MTARIANAQTLAPEGLNAMLALEKTFQTSGLDPVLMDLVRLRASQINGCAYCIHMHSTDLRRIGESEMRLYMLDAWRESTLYTDRERAALGWTEALTRVAETHAPDADYEALKAQFSDAEQVQLTLLIGSINVWNRVNVGLRTPHPVEHARAAA
jgi:AhpD family alkylhydroperoxidase